MNLLRPHRVAIAMAIAIAGGLSTLAAQRPAQLVFDAAVSRPNVTPGGNSGGCRGIDSRLGSAAIVFRPRVNAPTSSTPMGRCVIVGARLEMLASIAFDITPNRITGIPSFFRAHRFDIEARAEDPGTTTERQLLTMLQAFLAEQFKLTARRDMTTGPIYALVVAKNGTKNLRPSKAEDRGMLPSMLPEGTGLVFRNYSMQDLAEFFGLLPTVQRPVTDKTGLNGRYDFTLEVLATATDGVADAKNAMGRWDTIFSDVPQQIGLRFEPSTGPVETLVVERAELPREP